MIDRGDAHSDKTVADDDARTEGKTRWKPQGALRSQLLIPRSNSRPSSPSLIRRINNSFVRSEGPCANGFRLQTSWRGTTSRSQEGASRFRQSDSVHSARVGGRAGASGGSSALGGCDRPGKSAPATHRARQTRHPIGFSEAAAAPQTGGHEDV